jgi:hypothetical protein
MEAEPKALDTVEDDLFLKLKPLLRGHAVAAAIVPPGAAEVTFV